MAFFYHNPRLMLLAISLIVVAGLSSYFVLPRMEDPQLIGRGAFVHTLFPGAEPERVESLVTEKIEDALSEIGEIKELRSASRKNISTIAIELRDDVMDGDRVWTKIRDKLKDVSPELPTGARNPNFEEMDFKAFALLVGLRWEQDGPVNFAILNRLAKQLEDRLKSLSGTEKVKFFGQPAEEVLVSLDAAQVVALNLSVADVARQIQASDSKIAAGQIRGPNEEMLIEVAGELNSIQRIETIPIRSAGRTGFVRLSNIARVEKTMSDPPDSLAIVDGRPAVVLGTFVRHSLRIDEWAADVKPILDDFESELPRGVVLDRIYDQNDYVAHRMNKLLQNLFMGCIAVFVVVFFLMGLRSAIVVSLALPLSAMMVLFGMRVMGVPVHQMSITGLIIALGLLIDNAIIIVEETSIRLRAGLTPVLAVTDSVRHLFLPLFGSTFTTALAFAPIALMPGPAGEFVGAIAINVIVAIFSSLFLALTIIPAIAARFNSLVRAPLENATVSRRYHWWQTGYSNPRLTERYRQSLDYVYRRPWLGIGSGLALPVLGFLAATQLPEQFFPAADRDQLQIEVELSPQSSLAGTMATTAAIRAELLNDPAVRQVDWYLGASAPAFYYNIIPRRSGVPHYAQAMVQLQNPNNQAATIHRLQQILDAKFAHARVLVRQLEQGPPFDAPVEVRLFGPDLERLQQLGEQLRQILVNTPNVIHTRSEMDERLPRISLAIKEENARAAGLSLSDVAMQLDAATEGIRGGSIVEATEELPVRVRLGDANRVSLEGIAALDFVAGTANPDPNRPMPDLRYRGVPLSALADVSLTFGFATINHLAGRRLNEIQAYIPAGALPSFVLADFQNRLKDSDFEIPPGYELSYGGEVAKRDEAVGNLLANIGILAVLMVATLVLSFGSFRVASIVGCVGLLSVGLGLGSLWLFGFSFGFMAIIGTMGLIGVAINDTIVVLATIRSDPLAATGDPVAMREVVMQSTRHIISTTVTTIAGFTPLILGGGAFWPPLAVAISGGVGGATILALYFVPSCYRLLIGRHSTRDLDGTAAA